jgi:hypothetical protein
MSLIDIVILIIEIGVGMCCNQNNQILQPWVELKKNTQVNLQDNHRNHQQLKANMEVSISMEVARNHPFSSDFPL